MIHLRERFRVQVSRLVPWVISTMRRSFDFKPRFWTLSSPILSKNQFLLKVQIQLGEISCERKEKYQLVYIDRFNTKLTDTDPKSKEIYERQWTQLVSCETVKLPSYNINTRKVSMKRIFDTTSISRRIPPSIRRLANIHS